MSPGLRAAEDVMPDKAPFPRPVEVVAIPKWLARTFLAGVAVLIGLGVWIGVEVHQCARWTHSSATTLATKFHVPTEEEK